MRFSELSFFALFGATAVSARPQSCGAHKPAQPGQVVYPGAGIPGQQSKPGPSGGQYTSYPVGQQGKPGTSGSSGTSVQLYPALPLAKFGNFTTLSKEEAKAGFLKGHDGSISKIPNYPAGGYSKPEYVCTSFSTKSAPAPTGKYPTGGSSNGGTTRGNGAQPTSAPTRQPSGPSLASASSAPFPTGTRASNSSVTITTMAPTTTLPSSTTSSVSSSATSSAPSCAARVEWRSYPNESRHKFAQAFRCLMDAPPSGRYDTARNRYEDLARVHQSMVNSIHENNLFLLWHRYFVWTLEQIMQDECGLDVAFPWWDETLDSGNFAASSIFTSEFFGTLPRVGTTNDYCIRDGYFANQVANIGPGESETPHCLSRACDESQTSFVDRDFVNECNSRPTFPDMANCAEMGPHAFGHNGVGSVMADRAASTSDPAFFLHHLFVDRNYWLWQTLDIQSRTTSITGTIDLNTVISVQGLRPDVTVRDVLDTQNGVMCYHYSY